MVLSRGPQSGQRIRWGAGRAASLTGACAGLRRRVAPERGSQAVELALVLPLVVLVLLATFQLAVVGADLLDAHAIAREAARAAAIGDDADAERVAERAAGDRAVGLVVRRHPGALVEAQVRLRTRALGPAASLWLPARAVMREEAP